MHLLNPRGEVRFLWLTHAKSHTHTQKCRSNAATHTSLSLSLSISKSVSIAFISYNNSAGAPRSFSRHIYNWINGFISLHLSWKEHFLYYAYALVLECLFVCVHVWFPSLLISASIQSVNGSACIMTWGKRAGRQPISCFYRVFICLDSSFCLRSQFQMIISSLKFRDLVLYAYT